MGEVPLYAYEPQIRACLVTTTQAFHGGRHSSSSNARGWSQEAVAVWGGRAVGSLAAGALALASFKQAECKEVTDYRLSWDWKGLEEAIAGEVRWGG